MNALCLGITNPPWRTSVSCGARQHEPPSSLSPVVSPLALHHLLCREVANSRQGEQARQHQYPKKGTAGAEQPQLGWELWAPCGFTSFPTNLVSGEQARIPCNPQIFLQPSLTHCQCWGPLPAVGFPLPAHVHCQGAHIRAHSRVMETRPQQP